MKTLSINKVSKTYLLKTNKIQSFSVLITRNEKLLIKDIDKMRTKVYSKISPVIYAQIKRQIKLHILSSLNPIEYTLHENNN